MGGTRGTASHLGRRPARHPPRGESFLLIRSSLCSPARRRPTTTRRRWSGGPEPAHRAQASRRASTRKPLHAGPRPRADRFVTFLPSKRTLADQSQSEDRPLRLLGRSVLRLLGSSAFSVAGPSPARRRPGKPFSARCLFFSHFRVFCRSGSPRIPEAGLLQLRLGKAELSRECLRKGSADPTGQCPPGAQPRRPACGPGSLGGRPCDARLPGLQAALPPVPGRSQCVSWLPERQ